MLTYGSIITSRKSTLGPQYNKYDIDELDKTGNWSKTLGLPNRSAHNRIPQTRGKHTPGLPHMPA